MQARFSRAIPELRGHHNQIVAATSLSYNIGITAYRRSTLAKRFSAKDWKGARDAFLSWFYASAARCSERRFRLALRRRET